MPKIDHSVKKLQQPSLLGLPGARGAANEKEGKDPMRRYISLEGCIGVIFTFIEPILQKGGDTMNGILARRFVAVLEVNEPTRMRETEKKSGPGSGDHSALA